MRQLPAYVRNDVIASNIWVNSLRETEKNEMTRIGM